MAVDVLNGAAVGERECGQCHELKSLREFNTVRLTGRAAKSGKTGWRSVCRDCEPVMNAPYPQPGEYLAEPLTPGLAVTLAMAGVARAPASTPATGTGTGTDELLLLLLRRLPTGQRWTAAERGRWLRAFGAALDFLVETEASEA